MRISDWSSDVCSSDLSEAIQSGLRHSGLLRCARNDEIEGRRYPAFATRQITPTVSSATSALPSLATLTSAGRPRVATPSLPRNWSGKVIGTEGSEERRVGKSVSGRVVIVGCRILKQTSNKKDRKNHA